MSDSVCSTVAGEGSYRGGFRLSEDVRLILSDQGSKLVVERICFKVGLHCQPVFLVSSETPSFSMMACDSA